MSSIDKLLQTLSEAPEGHIDPQITKRLKGLIGGNNEIVAFELKVILDDCAHGALASDFAMRILDQAHHSVATEVSK